MMLLPVPYPKIMSSPYLTGGLVGVVQLEMSWSTENICEAISSSTLKSIFLPQMACFPSSPLGLGAPHLHINGL